MTDETVMGWDIGGAHLKAATVGPEGSVRVFLEACALWRGENELVRAMDRILARSGHVGSHLATMTGELVDLYPDRAQGVRSLVRALQGQLPREADLRLYSRTGALLSPEEALMWPEEAASANWRASAQAVGACLPDALVVDIGSTTSDLVPVQRGELRARGNSDRTRMGHGELLYTGAVRTPVMALGGRVPVAGAWVPLAAEWFATLADVHRLRGELPEGVELGGTADGGPADAEGSARRLARMVGEDADPRDLAPWRRLAAYLGEMQMRQLLDAAWQLTSGADLAPEAPVVGAGVGRFLARTMADRLGRPYRDFDSVVPVHGEARDPCPADCAPSVALALLLKGTRR